MELERVSGRGDLYQDGKRVCVGVRYSIRVSQRMHDVGAGESVPGLKNSEGDLMEGDGGGHFFSLMNAGSPVTLHLQDGRRWDCCRRG